MKRIRFIGDYKELKKHGFVFQKLYASNYMQWANNCGEEYGDCLRIWKRNALVEFDGIRFTVFNRLLALFMDKGWDIAEQFYTSYFNGYMIYYKEPDSPDDPIPFSNRASYLVKSNEAYEANTDSEGKIDHDKNEEVRKWKYYTFTKKQMELLKKMDELDMFEVIEG